MYHVRILDRVSYCLFRVAFYPFDISRESWFPYKFDLEKVPFADGVRVNRKIHSETTSCTALLGYVAHFCSVNRLQKFDFSFGKHLSNLLNWQDCSGLLHVYLLLVTIFCIWLLQGKFHFNVAEAVNQVTYVVWRTNTSSWRTANMWKGKKQTDRLIVWK